MFNLAHLFLCFMTDQNHQLVPRGQRHNHLILPLTSLVVHSLQDDEQKVFDRDGDFIKLCIIVGVERKSRRACPKTHLQSMTTST